MSGAARDVPAILGQAQLASTTAVPGQPASQPARETNETNSVAAPEGLQLASRVLHPDPILPVYPWRSRRLGQEGNVLVQVTYDDDGQFVDLELARSSGHRLLDREALAAVRRAPGRSSRRIELLEIVFKLEE